MEKVVSKIVGFGVPGLLLLTAMGATGLTGAAAFTASLATLGPGGMIGGLISLGVLAFMSDAIAEFGFNHIFSAVVKELYKRGETKETILAKIAKYPVSKSLKRKLIELIEKEENTPGDDSE
ncbi:hypothetical protein GCM10008932_16380 [Alkalibacterium iburiense]|uniref:Uncharacterized protein n=1 Tax=Alkalibacterium iburiense TaxID=290589 RepID=A0ABN0XI89_9LACT